MQNISVVTMPAGASCEARRGDASLGRVEATPGRLAVTYSRHDVALTCAREGFLPTVAQLRAIEQPGMAAAFFLAGGVAGLAMGAAQGALHRYPEYVMVRLVPERFPTAAARDAFFDARRAELEQQHDAEIARLRGGCPPGDEAYCRSILAPVEQRRDEDLAQLEGQRQAVRLDGVL